MLSSQIIKAGRFILLGHQSSSSILGATMLITGCCIGAGMIGLPVLSALAGFMPSTVAMFLCYAFTTLTGLLLLEATLWFDTRVNLLTIVESTLGKAGKVATLLLFLFLFYCLFVAYFDGGGALFADIFSSILPFPVSQTVGTFVCLGFVGGITYAGTRIVDGFNRVLLIGLVVTYVTLIAIGIPYVSQQNLTHVDWIATLGVVPILLICFGYQNLVPSVTYYLEKNVNAIRFAIIIGNLIPFFIYLLWDFVILGMLPQAKAAPGQEVGMVTQLLQGAVPALSVIAVVKAFSLFAMLTSFIPSAVSFVDFLKDGFKKAFHKEQKNELLVCGLVFIPPFICALVYPNLFLNALSFAGGFIDVLLFGVLPSLVILIGRNVKKMQGPYQVLGGNVTPVLILLLSLVILIIKVS